MRPYIFMPSTSSFVEVCVRSNIFVVEYVLRKHQSFYEWLWISQKLWDHQTQFLPTLNHFVKVLNVCGSVSVLCYFWLIPLWVYVSFSPFLCLSLSLCPGSVIVSFVCLSSVFWIGEGGQLWTTPALKTLRAGSRVCVCWTTLSLNGHSWGWNTEAVTHATGAFVSQTPAKRRRRGALIWSSC